MSIAWEYLDLFAMKCTFHTDNHEEGQLRPVCDQLAVAVYVSDDEEPKGRYVCQAHAEWAERHGDGPVFWQRRVKQQVVEPIEEFRLTLAEETEEKGEQV